MTMLLGTLRHRDGALGRDFTPWCGAQLATAPVESVRPWVRRSPETDPGGGVLPLALDARLRRLAVTDMAAAGLLPYLLTSFRYTDAQLDALLDAADELRTPIRAATFRTLLSLQAATGIRTGLDVGDVDLREAPLTATGKYSKTRLLPLHPTSPTG